MYQTSEPRPEYKKEAREQRARVARRDDRISALEQENEQLRDEAKRQKEELNNLKIRLKEYEDIDKKLTGISDAWIKQ